MPAKMTIRLRSHTTIRRPILIFDFPYSNVTLELEGARTEIGIHYLQGHREIRKQKSPPAFIVEYYESRWAFNNFKLLNTNGGRYVDL